MRIDIKEIDSSSFTGLCLSRRPSFRTLSQSFKLSHEHHFFLFYHKAQLSSDQVFQSARNLVEMVRNDGQFCGLIARPCMIYLKEKPGNEYFSRSFPGSLSLLSK